MKKAFILFLGLFLLTVSAPAQLVRSRTFDEKEKVRVRTGYDRVSVGYDIMLVDARIKILNGVNFQYAHGFKIAKVPLFLELGTSFHYNTGQYITYEKMVNNFVMQKYRDKLENVSLRIPINVSYRFNVGDRLSLQPYTGVNFKLNVFSRLHKYRFFQDYGKDNPQNYAEKINDENKFQIGWQIGMGLNISKVWVGLNYGLDFRPIAKVRTNSGSFNWHSSQVAASLGYTF